MRRGRETLGPTGWEFFKRKPRIETSGSQHPDVSCNVPKNELTRPITITPENSELIKGGDINDKRNCIRSI